MTWPHEYDPKRYRYVAFGYNRFKQKGIRIGCPGGQILLTREVGGTVRVELLPDGAEMDDHVGEIETEHGGRVRGRVSLRLIHEEVKERERPEAAEGTDE